MILVCVIYLFNSEWMVLIMGKWKLILKVVGFYFKDGDMIGDVGIGEVRVECVWICFLGRIVWF